MSPEDGRGLIQGRRSGWRFAHPPASARLGSSAPPLLANLE